MNDEEFRTTLEWFVEGFLSETPTSTQRRGVWHGDYDVAASGSHSTPSDLAGGSRLGSPDMAETFRQYIENSPRQLSRGGAYARPFRAALAEMKGRHRCTPLARRMRGHVCGESAIMARFLFALGMAQGDWRRTAAAFGIAPPLRKAYTWTALKRVEGRYTSYPLRRSWVDLSDSQRAAVQEGETAPDLLRRDGPSL